MSKNVLIRLVVIAGPGSGKTTDMVGNILAVLPDLEPHRMLATVTYTNSAADTIRKRLTQKVGVPKNVFVGTIHSFLNQFIIIPYATLFQQAGIDKLFLDIDVDAMAESKVAVGLRKNPLAYYAVKNKIKSQILLGLLQSGKIPLKQINFLALELMKINEVQIAVCNRLQFLFVDEFQDVDITQFEIFDRIRKSNKTHIYAFGDPEQYIMGYTYQGRQKPPFSKLPINRFKADKVPKTENHRSTSELVAFNNQFHYQIQQTSTKGNHPQSRILFIANNSLENIVQAYQKICAQIDLGERPVHFYLSHENKTFEGVSRAYGLTPLLVQHSEFKTAFNESMDLICNLVGLTKSQIAEKYGLEPIDVRRMSVMLLDAISKGDVHDKDTAIKFVQEKLNLQISSEYELEGKDLIRSLLLILQSDQNTLASHQYSSIHKAKGLEADAVLVVARNKTELARWLTTDKNARANDNSDVCRIGYVAFTRAKILLCIACLQPLDEGMKQILAQVGASLI